MTTAAPGGAVADPPQGIDGPRVTAWLAREVDGMADPYRFDLIAGGHSNLTFMVTDATGRRIVLRRPPISHVLSTAHDMGREYRIISALRDTCVPVPGTLGFCEDSAVNGAPFYVMDFVDGHVLRDGRSTERLLDEELRRTAGNDLVDVLVAIHEVDVDAVGLGDLGRREAYVARQLKRWHQQFQLSQRQEEEGGFGRPAPIVDEVHDTLVEQMPPQRTSAIVHGDYRLDNTLIGDGGRVNAVLDWELCTLGEPLADLGTLHMYWSDRDDETEPEASSGLRTTSLPGFPTRAELAARYASTSGQDISDLPYYVAFAHWRLACIIEGVYVRYATGAMGGDLGAAAGFAEMVTHQGDLARRALS